VCTGTTIHYEQAVWLRWQGKECEALCSGCITSAETVLLQAQSADEFREAVQFAAVSGGRKAVVVSISPQSRASLAYAAAGTSE